MMTPGRHLRRCCGALALCLIAACAGPTYKTRYYSLMADPHAEPLVTTESTVENVSAPSLGVGPVRLPEMLDHAGIVSWGDGQRVQVAPYDIWAGDLKETITRVLADNLSTYLATENVWPFPWDNRVRPDRHVTIVFERLDGQRGGEVVLQAKWRLLSKDNEVLLSERIGLQARAASGSYDAYVAALNELINQMSQNIAQVVSKQQRAAG